MFMRPWSPYLAGSLAGILLILSVLIAGKFFGTSTTFARSAAVVMESVGIDTTDKEYFSMKKGKYGASSLPNWQLMFVIGIVIGAFIASKLSGEFKLQTVPDMWQERFGPSSVKRGVIAFLGGIIALVGARLAGG